jgi:hypothetical protein
VIRLVHDEEGQVVPDADGEPVDELLGRNAEL